MNNLELATTFPEAKPILKRLIKEDKDKIRSYNELKNKVRGNLIRKGVHEVDLTLELIMVMITDNKQHIIKSGATWNEVLSCEERLKKNQSILSFMEGKGHPEAVDWMNQIAKAKQYPIDNLLDFNRGNVTKCIWHVDSNPSLHYYKKTNSVFCFSCNHGGDAIDVVMKLKNCKLKEAVNQLI